MIVLLALDLIKSDWRLRSKNDEGRIQKQRVKTTKRLQSALQD